MPTTAAALVISPSFRRAPLLQAAKDSDTAAPSILNRILDPEQRASVEVAASQSSV